MAIFAALIALRRGLVASLEAIATAATQPAVREALAHLPDARELVSGHPERRRIERIGLLAYRAGAGARTSKE